MSDTKPKVGDGATVRCGSDSYPYTIVNVSPKSIVVQLDSYKREDNRGPFTESQTYTYTCNTKGSKLTFTLRKNGRWVRKGDTMKGQSVGIGFRRAYQDPSF